SRRRWRPELLCSRSLRGMDWHFGALASRIASTARTPITLDLTSPSMRAVRCKQFGPPESLVLEDVDDPVPAPGQVVIDVHACGVNFPDVLIIQNRYQFEPP